MGDVLRYVPPGQGKPAPEPPNAWDGKIVEGPHRHRIAELLDELTAIAVFDWTFRHLASRRNDIFVELAKLQITRGRMMRAYAIDGKPLITHVGIKNLLDRRAINDPDIPTANTRQIKEEE